jgi:hypothetical protein
MFETEVKAQGDVVVPLIVTHTQDDIPVVKRSRARSLINRMRQKIQHTRTKSNNVEEIKYKTILHSLIPLDQVLNNDDMTNELLKYAVKEYSQENIILYQRIRNWKKTQNYDEAQELYLKYMKRGAPEEVNLEAYITTDLEKRFQERTCIIDAFELALISLLRNIQDTYSRLLAENKL